LINAEIYLFFSVTGEFYFLFYINVVISHAKVRKDIGKAVKFSRLIILVFFTQEMQTHVV
jgi:hypothetical protein